MNFPDAKNPKFICGRPLGMAFDTISDNLIVMDTTDGIFELNLTSGEKKHFVSDKAVIGLIVRKHLMAIGSILKENIYRIHDLLSFLTPWRWPRTATCISPIPLLIMESTGTL